MERRCWLNFQCRGVLLVWMIVGQGPIALAVGAGGGCLDIFSLIYLFSFLSPSLLGDDPDLIYLFSFLSPSLWETARYRLKYCLKGPLNPKQPTNQPRLINLNRPTLSCLASLYILSVLSVYVSSVSLKNSGNLRKLPKQGY